MTTEVVILNRQAVALAADSAVTLGDGTKIYNRANKLFTLSKKHPIGVMIFNRAEICGVAWETLIKKYRDQLCDKSFDTVQEYAEDFFQYIQGNTEIFPKEEQEFFFRDDFILFWRELNHQAKQSFIFTGISKENNVEYLKKLHKVILNRRNFIENMEKMGHRYNNYIANSMDLLSDDLILELLKSLPPIDPIEKCKKVVKEAFQLFVDYRRYKTTSLTYTGLVFAGFGDQQIFPAASVFHTDLLPGSVVRYFVKQSHTLTHRDNAVVIPLADDSVIRTFLDGIDPDYLDFIFDKFLNLSAKISEIIFEKIDHKNDEEKYNILKDCQADIRTEVINALEDMFSHGSQNHSDQINMALTHLPKDELAHAAETLVSLSSFRKKVSIQKDTVGGPIDVAVISKGDGFIWINRKHYFKQEQNFHFFKNYYDNMPNQNGGDEGATS